MTPATAPEFTHYVPLERRAAEDLVAYLLRQGLTFAVAHSDADKGVHWQTTTLLLTPGSARRLSVMHLVTSHEIKESV